MMKMRRALVSGMLLWLMLLLPCHAHASPKLMSRQTDAYFSTVSALFLYDEPEQSDRFAAAWAKVKEILAEVEQSVSLSFPDSDISRFNALPCGGSVAISDMTAAILTTAMEVYAQTGGLYDPTVYPLVDLWGFSPRFNRNAYSPLMPYDRAFEDGRLPAPKDSDISALLPLVGLSGVRLYRDGDVWRLQKHTPSVVLGGAVIHAQLDLGGIAKGYACDAVRRFLLEQGYTMGHFVCGESSMSILSRPSGDGLYRLTMGKPRPGAADSPHYASIRIRDAALSTSSDSTHFRLYDGMRYSHIIDPRTGRPMNAPESGIQRGAASVSLLCESAAYGDAMSTALCLMSPQEAAAFISANLSGTPCVIAYAHSGAETLEVLTSTDAFTLEDPSYLPASIIDEHGTLRYTGAFFAP